MRADWADGQGPAAHVASDSVVDHVIVDVLFVLRDKLGLDAGFGLTHATGKTPFIYSEEVNACGRIELSSYSSLKRFLLSGEKRTWPARKT